eukprot:gnl/TRDRNA2_/TRDRNA2_155266_c8_seq3.p1 gnl/TRDRNA2_/TRDRNA2_155266_c8~~gnl/TRDRNA2_/TRDRNA2_155266_c8_seq3.p1  ORF type:complete len:605 (+),score=85.13 gnl/TRDRNA2_/TRDRNA2_155266_c8_seq3:40-1815(+)
MLPGDVASVLERRTANDNFRSHAGFVGLIFIWAGCTIYLMTVLQPIIRPFLWALFLVMGITPAVASTERAILCAADLLCRCTSALMRCICACSRWTFGSIPCCRKCCVVTPSRSGPVASASSMRFAKKRLSPRRGDGKQSVGSPRSPAAQPAVIGSLSGSIEMSRVYGGNAASSASGGGGDSAAGEREPDDYFSDDELHDHASWTPCARFSAHVVAMVFVVGIVLGAIAGFVIMVIQSVISLQDNWAVYEKGARTTSETVQHMAARAFGTLPREVSDEIAMNALVRAEAVLSALIGEILSNGWRFVLEFLMMALYIAFWLTDPMPIGTSVEELFKRYIILKGLACLGYGICVGILLHILSIDLAAVFGLAAFCLSFIPEVGAFVAIVLPAPVILFDSRLEAPALTLVSASVAQLGLKFVFANVVEVKLVEADQLMKMHPVIILLAVACFGYIWGPTGMLLSVPLVAYVKLLMLGDSVPSRYRDPVLILLEGDLRAPAVHDKRRQAESERRADSNLLRMSTSLPHSPSHSHVHTEVSHASAEGGTAKRTVMGKLSDAGESDNVCTASVLGKFSHAAETSTGLRFDGRGVFDG